MTKSLSYCGSFKDKYNRRYGLVYMVGYGVLLHLDQNEPPGELGT